MMYDKLIKSLAGAGASPEEISKKFQIPLSQVHEALGSTPVAERPRPRVAESESSDPTPPPPPPPVQPTIAEPRPPEAEQRMADVKRILQAAGQIARAEVVKALEERDKETKEAPRVRPIPERREPIVPLEERRPSQLGRLAKSFGRGVARTTSDALRSEFGMVGGYLADRLDRRAGVDRGHGPISEESAEPEAAMVDGIEGLGRSLEAIMEKVEYGVRESTTSIVEAVDRITQTMQADRYKEVEERAEAKHAEIVKDTQSPSSQQGGDPIARLLSGVGLLTGGDPTQSLNPVTSGDPLIRTGDGKDEVTIEADTIEVKTYELILSAAAGKALATAFATGGAVGGSGGGGGGGSGATLETGGDPPVPGVMTDDGGVAPKGDRVRPSTPGQRDTSTRRRTREQTSGGQSTTPSSAPTTEGHHEGGATGDMIGRGEGGYGSFNRGVAGDSRGKLDPNMTVGDIMQQQAKPRGDRSRLFAVGKYQVIPSTMRDAVKSLGIKPDEKFTPELQERIYREYLIKQKRPQVHSYVTGKSDDLIGAQLAMAREFASVADPRTGRSVYAGQAGNAASISAATTERNLRAEREQYRKNREAGMGEDEAWSALSGGRQRERPTQGPPIPEPVQGAVPYQQRPGFNLDNGPAIPTSDRVRDDLRGAATLTHTPGTGSEGAQIDERSRAERVMEEKPASPPISRSMSAPTPGAPPPLSDDDFDSRWGGDSGEGKDLDPPSTSKDDHFKDFPGLGWGQHLGIG